MHILGFMIAAAWCATLRCVRVRYSTRLQHTECKPARLLYRDRAVNAQASVVEMGGVTKTHEHPLVVIDERETNQNNRAYYGAYFISSFT